MLILQTKYAICRISPFIEFHAGNGEMTERFEKIEMYATKEEAQSIVDTWDEHGQEGTKVIPIEITCRL